MQGWGFDSHWDNPFSKCVSTRCTVMSASIKWHMLRVTTTEKKLLNVVLSEDKWCKYPWQAALTLCLNPALALRRCGSMLALRGPSWIKASGGLAGCILGLAACLTRHFSVLNTEQGRAETGQNLLRLKQ